MKWFAFISRIFVGLVFVFSGFVKAIDPTGFAIKLEEYFLAFNLEFLLATVLPLSVLAAAAEVMIGLNLLIRTRMCFTAWVLMLFMSFFTVLTLILALTNPVSDCGCFGEAVILTNWQTFWKNIIIDLPTVVIFLYRRKYQPISTPLTEWALVILNIAASVAISVYCLLHEPVMDFRPYSIGTHIPDEMIIPEGAPLDQYETILVYEKDGVKKEFAEDNYPWQDTTWKWVETKQNLISKGYEPPIHDFSITSAEGFDLTEQVLNETWPVLLIISPKLENASTEGMQKLNELTMKGNALDFQVICLTSSSTDAINAFKATYAPAFEICTADETTLKTIIRANPGLLLLNQGTITGKWHYRDAPEPATLKQNMLPIALTAQNVTRERMSVIIIALLMLLVYVTIWPSVRKRIKTTKPS